MSAEEHRGLGLLIALSSAGCLGLPRYTDDEIGDGDGDGTTQTIDEGPEGPSPDGPEGPRPTSVAGDAESFLFMPDLGPITSPTTVADEAGVTTDPPPSGACQAYSSLVTECYGPEAGEAAFGYCVEYLGYAEESWPECVPAFEEFLVCISMLDCMDLGGGEPICEMELQTYFECQQD
jgi:hypothetical protein